PLQAHLPRARCRDWPRCARQPTHRRWLPPAPAPPAKGTAAPAWHRPPDIASHPGQPQHSASCARHECIDQRGHRLTELLLEEHRGQSVLERKAHVQLGAAAVLADRAEQPLALEGAERPADELHGDAPVGLELVAGRELPMERALANPHGCHYLPLAARENFCVGAPRQEARIAFDVVDDLEDPAWGLGNDGRMPDLLHAADCTASQPRLSETLQYPDAQA